MVQGDQYKFEINQITAQNEEVHKSILQVGYYKLEIKYINAQNVEVLLELTQVNVTGWIM